MPLLPRVSSLWRNLFHKSLTERELVEWIGGGAPPGKWNATKKK